MPIHPNISPSPSTSLATLLLPRGCAGEAQRQSRRNAGGANSGGNMIDYPPHHRRINKDQEDYDDRVSNPTDTEIAAYERWMVEQEQQEPHRREPRQTVPCAPS
jgi:hypothetical protein